MRFWVFFLCLRVLMAVIIEGPFPFKLAMEEVEEKKLASSDSGSDDPMVGVLFFGISLILGVASKHLLRGSKVPYTVALLVIGVGLGFLGVKAARLYHQESGYMVETRARVIIFDMGALEEDVVLQKRSASWILQTLDLPSGQKGEHNAVTALPEKLVPRRLREHSQGIDRQPISLSARTMELSIFGSMVNITHTSTQSIPESSHPISPHNQGAEEFRGPSVSTPSNESRDNNDVLVRIDSPVSLH